MQSLDFTESRIMETQIIEAKLNLFIFQKIPKLLFLLNTFI